MLAGAVLEPPAERVVEVKIAKNSGMYRLDVVTKTLEDQTLDEEHAEFPGQMSCFEVLYRAALRAAVQMNKGMPVAETPQTQVPEPPPRPRMRMPPALPQQPSAARAKTNTPRQTGDARPWRVGLGGSTVLGAAPTAVVGLQLTVGWHWAPSRFIEGNVRGTFPTAALPNGVTPIFIESLGTATIAPCYQWKFIGGCGLLTGNILWARSSGLDRSKIGASFTLAGGIRGFIEHRFSERWSMRLDADLVSPIVVRALGDMATQDQWLPTPINGAANATLFVSF